MTTPERLYYFTPTKYALENVQKRRLKVAELDKANDPYEALTFRWPEGSTTEEVLHVQRDASELLKLLCFSETYEDPSLWGHYADRCRGICLGFEIEPNHMQDLFLKIEYVKDRLEVREFKFSSSPEEDKHDEGIYDIRHYKSDHWKHENEWRMWVTENQIELDSITGQYFYYFNRSGIEILKLREILIGIRCKEENIKRRFEKLIEQYPEPPDIFYTDLSSDTFQIKKR